MESTTKKTLEESIQESSEVMAYATSKGIELPSEMIDTLSKARYEKDWNPDKEKLFWEAFAGLMKQVHPITLNNIRNARMPGLFKYGFSWMGSFPISLSFFLVIALGLVITTLFCHTYYKTGVNIVQKLETNFKKRNELRLQLSIFDLVTNESYALNQEGAKAFNDEKHKTFVAADNADQLFDASIDVLKDWSKFWYRWVPFYLSKYQNGKLSSYDSLRMQGELLKQIREIAPDTLIEFQSTGDLLQKICYSNKIDSTIQKLAATCGNIKLNIARNAFYKLKFTTDFVLDFFGDFLLPALYGFLGAICFILRQFFVFAKNGLFTYHKFFDFILRLMLGGLAGMVSAFIMNGDTDSPFMGFSSVALAFLVGYNLEVLFSSLDRLAGKVTNFKKEKPEET